MAEKRIEVARELKQAKKEKERDDKQRADKVAPAAEPAPKPEVKAEPEVKVEPKPEVKAEPKPEPAPAAKPEKAEPAKKEEKPKKEAKAKEEKKEEVLEERILTIPLRDAWNVPRTRRTRAAIKILKKQLERHLKKPVVLDVTLNKAVWKKGIQKPPRRIKVKARIMKERAKIYPVEGA